MTFEEALFPHAERVLYAQSPLTQVICQIRFPSILRIESQAPADFQDQIRDAFPVLERVAAIGGQQIPPEMARILGLPDSGASYNFSTEDGKYKCSLAGGYISLTCDDYSRWEDFESKLSRVVSAFVGVYRPSFYTRIGLRYINMIDRERLRLEGVPWSDLLRSEALGVLCLPQWEARTFEARSSFRVQMTNNEGTIFLQHGLNKTDDAGKFLYAIDFDFYKDNKTEVGSAAAVLEKFHDRSGRAFAWCITDRLRSALGPQQPDAQHG